MREIGEPSGSPSVRSLLIDCLGEFSSLISTSICEQLIAVSFVLCFASNMEDIKKLISLILFCKYVGWLTAKKKAEEHIDTATIGHCRR